jgi:hypothetical protein
MTTSSNATKKFSRAAEAESTTTEEETLLLLQCTSLMSRFKSHSVGARFEKTSKTFTLS